MPISGTLAPAILWRAFLFFAIAVAGVHGAAPPTVFPELAQIGKPNAEQAAQLIAQFRTAGIAGDYYLEFELQPRLRRGKAPTLQGRWWGTRNEQGALSRIEITGAAGEAHRFILQNGDGAAVWRLTGGRAVAMEPAAQLAPLVPGVEVSAFDLLMPFLYWPGPTVEKITRMLGRPTYQFLLAAPPAFAAAHAEVGAVRAWLDTQFNAPMQIDVIGGDGRTRRSMSILELKKVGEQHLPREVDYRNEVTRDKTRLVLTGAALKLQHPSSLFDPTTLAQPASPIGAPRFVRLDP